MILSNMRIRKLSLKKCIYLAVICALLLIFYFNNKNYEELDTPHQHQKGNKKFDTRFQSKTFRGNAWYFSNTEYNSRPPMANRIDKEHRLLPSQVDKSDRIVNQLMYVPQSYHRIVESGQLKTILLVHGLRQWNVKRGRDIFRIAKCPVHTCELTDDMQMASTADMMLHKEKFKPTGKVPKNSKQINMLFSMATYVPVPDGVNWTATHRRDSTIVAPYTKWVYYDDNVQERKQDRNYAANKTKKVAWFVSNCNAVNGRLKYALELQHHIKVDIYGACGKLKCSRSTPEKCLKLLENYKFYLAFEDSNCMDYITEKYLVNALDRGVLPIVMGARPADYEELAPRHSYIHVDNFESAKELAEYLRVLDRDDDQYNSYFLWRGTGEFIDTHFWCRVCAMLHYEDEVRDPARSSNERILQGMCIRGSWRGRIGMKDTHSLRLGKQDLFGNIKVAKNFMPD
ncbi:glycoprotein 3-alpha-L-fucosyltransferase A-like [Drosophila obscura]|uniref:glycoprotein 3-alpha-L-fucosyltransferase A-like n=1 Tax=Drosophila obscura TaxID=7282 RepID=UPI001BB28D2F|nr:glycoprotein 3-alpha-L-fucosyltransferase A-like [Drosophila obscura]